MNVFESFFQVLRFFLLKPLIHQYNVYIAAIVGFLKACFW